jgi:glycine/D-amino acid oxidase-like deaminating enzyme
MLFSRQNIRLYPQNIQASSNILGMDGPFDYVILGGGCIGFSTALELIQRQPEARVIIVEGSDQRTASKGISRIVRTPYYVPEYASLAYEAKTIWEKDDLYNQHYKRPGWVQIVQGNDYVPFHAGEREVDAVKHP